jgi:membrane protease YdiL (CAAX protease family)
MCLSLLSVTLISGAALALSGIDMPVTGMEVRIPPSTFTILALCSSTGFLGTSILLMAVFRGPVPLGLRASAVPAGAAGLAMVLVFSIGGSFLGSLSGETYLGAPDLESGGLWAAGTVLAAVLIAPALEELFFREILMTRVLGSLPQASAIATSSLAFGLFHLASGGLILVASLTAMGAVMGWLRMKTDSLAPPFLIHALNNLLALVVLS